MSFEEQVNHLARLIRESRYTVVLTGAGISAESGIPTFRGPGGLWEKYRPEELASPEAFHRDPLLVWRWYAWRMRLIRQARPNKAHLLLARLQRDGLIGPIITQNVDGLHQRAGAEDVIELHGNIWRVRCTRCSYSGRLQKPPDDEELPLKCPECGRLLRPGVVWFGEPLPRKAIERAYREAASAELMIVIGTSGAVYPAAELPRITRFKGGHVAVIDPGVTTFEDIADVRIKESAVRTAEALSEKLYNPQVNHKV